MGFFTRAFTGVRSFFSPRRLFSSLSTSGVSWNDFVKFLGGDSRSAAGVKVTTKNALGYPALWRGVNLICDGTRKCGIHLYKKSGDGSRARQTQHESYKRMDRKANPLLTSGIFKQVMTFHAVFWGNGRAAIIRNGRGEAVELLILNPAETDSVMLDGKLWHVTKMNGEQVRLRDEDVLNLRRLSRDGINGFSIVDLFKESLGLGIAARKFGAHFFGGGSKASGILMIPGNVPEERQKNILSAWAKMATKLKKSHKVALIQDGVKYQQLTIPPEQGQFLQTRQFENREVSLILGIPPHKLADTTRTSYNSLEQEERAWLIDGLDPWFVMWEEECNDKLLSKEEKESGDFYFRFNREEMLQMSFKDRMEGIAKGFATGRFSVNDQLRMDDLPTVGPAGDTRWRPANLIPIDSVPAGKTPAEKPPAGKPPEKAPEKPAPEKKPDDAQQGPEDAQQKEARRAAKRAHAKAIDHAFYQAVRERFEGALKVECREVTAAAKRGGNFLAWAEEFYARHETRLREGISASLMAFYTLRKMDSDQAGLCIETFARSHCTLQRTAVIEATEVAASELTASMESLVQRWNDGEAYGTLNEWALCNGIYLTEQQGGSKDAA